MWRQKPPRNALRMPSHEEWPLQAPWRAQHGPKDSRRPGTHTTRQNEARTPDSPSYCGAAKPPRTATRIAHVVDGAWLGAVTCFGYNSHLEVTGHDVAWHARFAIHLTRVTPAFTTALQNSSRLIPFRGSIRRSIPERRFYGCAESRNPTPAVRGLRRSGIGVSRIASFERSRIKKFGTPLGKNGNLTFHQENEPWTGGGNILLTQYSLYAIIRKLGSRVYRRI